MEIKKDGRGGARPGAGRKPLAKVVLNIAPPPMDETEPVTELGPEPELEAMPLTDMISHKDPKTFLIALMNDPAADVRIRSDAAKALMPFVHAKLGEGGKKEKEADLAKKIAKGKFAPSAPPKLVANGGKSV